MKTVWVNYLKNNSPAMVNRFTGTIYINSSVYNNLPDEHKLFIKLHEQGHYVLDTTDEFKADEYAFKEYVRQGFSLTESIKALSRILSLKSPEHIQRVYAQYKRALLYDANINKNEKATLILNNMQSNYEGSEIFNKNLVFSNDSFLGIRTGLTKRSRQKIDERDALKAERYRAKTAKKAAKGESKLIRAEAKQTKATAKQTKAEKGTPSAGTQLLETGLGLAKSFLQPQEQVQETKGLSMTTIIIIIVIVLILILALLYFFKWRKK